MALREYTVVGSLAAYGAQPGETVMVDDSDPLVKLNITAGVIMLTSDQPEKEREVS
jgi:hypothetical protein